MSLKRKPATKGGNMVRVRVRVRVCRVVPAIPCSFLNVRFLCVQWQGGFFKISYAQP